MGSNPAAPTNTITIPVVRHRRSRKFQPMNNYEYCAEFAARSGAATALDFGCGAGEVVQLMRSKQIEAFGCDAYYGGGQYAPLPEVAQFITGMPEGRIPFADGFFDIVINNQVLEHVTDLDGTIAEMARVLKPGGTVLSIFPDNRMWREGHCGIPFVQHFPANRARTLYAYALCCLGFGYFKGGKTRWQWAVDACEWLDKWTYYRSYDDITAAFERHFGPIRKLEADWLDARLGLRIPLPEQVKQAFVHRMAGLVIACSRVA